MDNLFVEFVTGGNLGASLRYDSNQPILIGATVSVTDDPSSSSVESGRPLADLSLHSGYPNPFDVATTITVSAAAATEFSLAVYDVAGRQVANLADGHYSIGDHSFVWDSQYVASGLYYARLTSNKSSRVSGLVVAR